MVQKGLIKGIQLVPRVKQGSTILSTSRALIRINTCMNYDEFYSTEHIAAVPIYNSEAKRMSYKYTPLKHLSGVLRLTTLEMFKWLPKEAFILTRTLPLVS